MSGPRATGAWTPPQVGMARWVRQAACASRPRLPWTSDPDLIGPADREEMASVCRLCPVGVRCAAAAARLDVTAGFWAGRQRDIATRTVQDELIPAEAWVSHRLRRASAAAGAHRWEQAAMTWPDNTNAADGAA